jgi:hypothetical protein
LQQQRRHVFHTSRARERLVELPTARKDARRSRSRATTEPHVLDLVDILLGADALGYVEARPFRENEQQRTSTVRRRQQTNKMPPKAAPAHPKYEDMVKAAILCLKDRNGSSFHAIAEHLGSNFQLPFKFKEILKTQLENLVKSGKLLKVNGRFMLGIAWLRNMRQWWLRYRSEKCLFTGLYALRSLPTELRQRVMEPVIDLQWRDFVAEYKHRFQSETARRDDLNHEISNLGCCPVSVALAASVRCPEIELWGGFVVNSLSARADGKQWTAKRVARRLAEMKYVYEYCRAFQDEVDETARKVEALTDGDYAWRKDRAERDACESITGYSSFGSFVRGLAEDWTDFPDRWPWNE